MSWQASECTNIKSRATAGKPECCRVVRGTRTFICYAGNYSYRLVSLFAFQVTILSHLACSKGYLLFLYFFISKKNLVIYKYSISTKLCAAHDPAQVLRMIPTYTAVVHDSENCFVQTWGCGFYCIFIQRWFSSLWPLFHVYGYRKPPSPCNLCFVQPTIYSMQYKAAAQKRTLLLQNSAVFCFFLPFTD